MKASDYQLWTERTAIYPKDESIIYTTIGLANEAGEVLGVVKKMMRDDGNVLTEEKRKKLIDETADVAWYMARICTELGISLEELFDVNVAKLEDRLKRNVIQGSGDNR
jgi:NTP pyrophosphatase (non-canonical NTP hydrolase)